MSTKPEECKKYLLAVKRNWKTDKMPARIDALHKMTGPTAIIQAEWEKIDRDISRAMSLGDKAAKRPMGTYA